MSLSTLAAIITVCSLLSGAPRSRAKELSVSFVVTWFWLRCDTAALPLLRWKMLHNAHNAALTRHISAQGRQPNSGPQVLVTRPRRDICVSCFPFQTSSPPPRSRPNTRLPSQMRKQEVGLWERKRKKKKKKPLLHNSSQHLVLKTQ